MQSVVAWKGMTLLSCTNAMPESVFREIRYYIKPKALSSVVDQFKLNFASMGVGDLLTPCASG